MDNFGLGLTPIDDRDRAWLDASCVALPTACCAVGEIPASYHPPLTKKNQRRTNRCAGFSFSTGREALNYAKTGTIEVYSAEAAYLLAKREYDGTANDNGTSISSLFASAGKHGTPREETCPDRGYVDRRDLTSAVLAEAAEHKIGQFVRLRSYNEVWRFLTSNFGGFVEFGGPWFEEMTVQRLGNRRETLASWRGEMLGFHARVFVGWFSQQEMERYLPQKTPSSVFDRPDLEPWNSHGDGPRPMAAEVVDAMADDPRCEIIGCMDQTEFAPREFVDWRKSQCLVS